MVLSRKSVLLFSSLVIVASLSFSSLSFGSEKTHGKKVDLPKLPEIWEIHKQLKKEDFQPQFVGLSEEKTTVDMNDPHQIKALRGFVGQNYIVEVQGQSFPVLENSLNIYKQDKWQAKGLVRNETLDTVGTILVEAQLLSQDGKVLETISTESLIKQVRPGEPVPFTMSSLLNGDQVYDVRWSAKSGYKKEAVSREANIMVNYEVPYGVAEYKGVKRDDAPYPYVLGTSFDNLSGPLKRAELVAVWLNENGKVKWIERANLDPLFKNGVGIEGSALFNDIVVSDANIAPLLSTLPYTLWVVGK